MRNKKGQFIKGHAVPLEWQKNLQRKGKKLSKETRRKISEALRGKNAPNWKGGISAVRMRIFSSYKYRQWRSDVYTRDNFICQDCGGRGGNLEAHHIKEMAIIVKDNNIKTLEQAMDCEEMWNINNGKTLCKRCHNKTKHFWGNQFI